MQCAGCLDELGGLDRRVAFIAVERAGDEYIFSYWHCGACESYMLEVYHDRFMGDDERSIEGPRPAADVAADLKRIAHCPDPSDKRCRCEAHRALGD